MARLVDRFGRTGFALLSSLIWALPMAGWAGSVDLAPGPGPWIAFGIGLVLLIGWLVLLTRLRRYPVAPRPHRLDLGAMSGPERVWNAVLAFFLIGLIGWLNGAATVDWPLLTPLVKAGRLGPTLLLVGLLGLLAILAAGAAFSWRRSTAEFRRRA